VVVSWTYSLLSTALFVCLSRCSAIFNRRALLEIPMDCPACGAPLTIEVGAEQPLSTSLRDAVLTAEPDERLEITRACWDCGWQEVRQVRVKSIDTTAGDETAVERAALIDEITDELAAIESVDTLEETLAAIRRQRATDPATTDTDDATE
jgi:predicted  nucleic acid-binding Zn-ribbon protein